jgi:hypothetical protein
LNANFDVLRRAQVTEHGPRFQHLADVAVVLSVRDVRKHTLLLKYLFMKDQDLIGLGLDGPRFRFCLPKDEYLPCKPILEICRDCVDMAKLADAPLLGKIGVFMRQARHDLAHQTTRLFKVSVLVLLMGLLTAAGIYVRWSNQQFRRYERALQRLGEKSEKERQTLSVDFKKLQKAARQAAAEEAQRVEQLKDSLGETSGAELRRLEKELQVCEQVFTMFMS